MRTTTTMSLLLLLLWCLPVKAQLTIPDRIDPYQPIVAGCDCIVPKNGQVQFLWQVDVLSKYIASADSTKLYIWAPPGSHTVEATVVTEVFQDMQVWVPDPASPNDVSKAQLKTIKTLLTFDVQRYNKTYMVGSDPTPNPPGPNPPTPPLPTPTDDFATQAQAWMKAIPSASYNKAKMLAVADNYSSTAAQTVATTGWDLPAFSAATKDKNLKTLTTTDIDAWRIPFFQPLYEYQAKLFNDQKLTTTDVQGIAKIWNATADAIRKAAF